MFILPIWILTDDSKKEKGFYEDIKDNVEKCLMKDETCGKIITKYVGTAPKWYGYKVQKDGHEIKGSEPIKSKGAKKPACKELTFYDYNKYDHDITNTYIKKNK